MTYLPYPEPRYRGETGEASARLRSADAAPEVSNPGGTTVHYLATGAGTDGQLGLYRWEMGPGPGGPDPHFHRSITESFYVLSGTIRLHDGNGWTTADRATSCTSRRVACTGSATSPASPPRC